MTGTRRRLPHVYPEGRWLFLTWCLHGALRTDEFAPPGKVSAREAFRLMDRRLDAARGAVLGDKVAALVEEALKVGAEWGRYELGPFVIMPNHVHTLILPKMEVARLMQSLKGYTAREANRLLNRAGQPFWQKESYDHWVRDGDEFLRIAAYIERNPVRAGLAASPQAYRWSSAFFVDANVDAARVDACAT